MKKRRRGRRRTVGGGEAGERCGGGKNKWETVREDGGRTVSRGEGEKGEWAEKYRGEVWSREEQEERETGVWKERGVWSGRAGWAGAEQRIS